jgi:hypothetical protein
VSDRDHRRRRRTGDSLALPEIASPLKHSVLMITVIDEDNNPDEAQESGLIFVC